MKILYYVELYPIRSSPLEYYRVSEVFCRNIKSHDSRIICNDQIYWKLYRNDLIKCNQRIPISTEIDNWINSRSGIWDETAINDWVLYLTSLNVYLSDYLVHVKKNIFDFDVIVIWGNNYTLEVLAKELGVKIVFVELTPSRYPYFEGLFISQTGTNGACSSPFSTENKIIKEPEFKEREKLLLPLQLYDDINMRMYSPFSDFESFIDYVVENFNVADYEISIKRHPASSLRSINKLKEDKAIDYALTKGFMLYDSIKSDFISDFESIITINSSVGYEAANMGKKVYVVGESCYKGSIITYSKETNNSETFKEEEVVSMLKEFSDYYFYDENEIEFYIDSHMRIHSNIEQNNINNLIPRSISDYIGVVFNTKELVFENKDHIMYKHNEYVEVRQQGVDYSLFVLEIVDDVVFSGAKLDKFPFLYKKQSEVIKGVEFVVVGASGKLVDKLVL